MATLPLNDIVNVVVSVSPAATARNAFNLGLIVGDSTVIDVADRAAEYANLNAMKIAGWLGTEPEYLAATLYFQQTPRPASVLIGVVDAGESFVEAVTACRIKNTEWYALYPCNATKTEVLALATYIETADPVSTMFYTTNDADVLNNVAGNVMETLKGLSIHRTIGQYSTVPYAAAAIMGYAMGATTGLTNSAYTLAYKKEIGVATEVLTLAQVTNIKANNGNVYVNRGNSYTIFEQGVMADGVSFDEVINLDKLTNDIRIGVMDTLVALPKVPQTDEGVSLLTNSIIGPCETARRIGFIAPGQWNAGPILGLSTGDTLSKGYAILPDSIANQSQADRDARIAPPIYVPIKLAGAVEHVLINIVVNR